MLPPANGSEGNQDISVTMVNVEERVWRVAPCFEFSLLDIGLEMQNIPFFTNMFQIALETHLEMTLRTYSVISDKTNSIKNVFLEACILVHRFASAVCSQIVGYNISIVI